MSNVGFLLVLLLASSVSGQSTVSPTSDSDAAEIAPASVDDRKSSTTVAYANAEADTDDLRSAESEDRPVVSDARAESGKGQTSEPDNGLETLDDVNTATEMEILEALLNETVRMFDPDINYKESPTINDSGEDDDSDEGEGGDDDTDKGEGGDDNTDEGEGGDDNNSDSDENDEDDNDKLSTDAVQTYLVHDPAAIAVNRQGDLNPAYEQMGEESEDLKPEGGDQESSGPIYVTVNDEPEASPLLLTQGGYQRAPYQRRTRINSQRQRMRAESASQQSETMESPPNNPPQPQAAPQVSYADPYHQQLGFGPGPIFRNPFMPPPGFMDANTISTNTPPQNNYFNSPPTGFADFTPHNFQAQFPPADSGFSALPRNPSPFPMFQPQTSQMVPNGGYVFQGPLQFPQMADPVRSRGYNFFTFPAPGSAREAPRTDIFGRPIAMNPQMQVGPNAAGVPFQSPYANAAASAINNPVNLLTRYPGNTGDRAALNPSYASSYTTPNDQDPFKPGEQIEVKVIDEDDVSSIENKEQKESDDNASPNKDDVTSVPFGTRIQKQNGRQDETGPSVQRDVYLRYPLTEAGYATEESLPVQNTTEKTEANNAANSRPVFPFFAGPRQFPGYSIPDPYRNAVNNVQRAPQGTSDTTQTNDNSNAQNGLPDQFTRELPFSFTQPMLSRQPSPLFPGRSQGISPFYSGPDATGNPFDQIPVFPDNYQFPAAAPTGSSEPSDRTPTCVKQTNDTLCFDDPEYPRRELLYALSSDSFLTDRLSAPDQRLDDIDLVDQNVSESEDSADNYICKSDIRKGLPLRARNVNGDWKVVVNVKRAIGNGKFIQPVRLEICRGASEPCSFTTEVKTTCVQKYSLHRLLSWSPEKGIHTDVYKLPLACSCQIVKT